MKFKLGSSRGPQPELLVPVLVSSEPGVEEPPVINYNVIEQLVMHGMKQHPEVTHAAVQDALSIDCKRTNVLIHIVQNSEEDDEEEIVKVGREKTVIPAGETKEVKCSVRTGPLPTKQEVLFKPAEIPRWPEGLNILETIICLQSGNWSKVTIPVTNESHHDIILTPGTVLGELQQVKAIYPVDVRSASVIEGTAQTSRVSKKTTDTVSAPEKHKEENEQRHTCTTDSWDPPVSVDHLTPDQQEKVRQMLKEECGLHSISAIKN